MITIPVEIDEDYQVVLPDLVCQRLGLQPHDTLLFVITDECVMLRRKPESFTQALRGLHQGIWGDVDVDEWLRNERADWE